jgi:hypothetical protein
MRRKTSILRDFFAANNFSSVCSQFKNTCFATRPIICSHLYIRTNTKPSRNITDISSYSSNPSHVIHKLLFRNSNYAVWITCNVEQNNEVTVNKSVVPFRKAWSWYNRSCSLSSAVIDMIKRFERPALEKFLIQLPMREHASWNFSEARGRITFHVTLSLKKNP